MLRMTLARTAWATAAWLAAAGLVSADPLPVHRPPFTQTLLNTAPLIFGITADDAAHSLGVPLIYVQGRPGNETFFAIRNDGGSGFFPRDDRLYLQFRRGRLTGIKGDRGRNWMWRPAS